MDTGRVASLRLFVIFTNHLNLLRPPYVPASGAFTLGDSAENEYLMKCLMRVVSFMGPEIKVFATQCQTQIVNMLVVRTLIYYVIFIRCIYNDKNIDYIIKTTSLIIQTIKNKTNVLAYNINRLRSHSSKQS